MRGGQQRVAPTRFLALWSLPPPPPGGGGGGGSGPVLLPVTPANHGLARGAAEDLLVMCGPSMAAVFCGAAVNRTAPAPVYWPVLPQLVPPAPATAEPAAPQAAHWAAYNEAVREAAEVRCPGLRFGTPTPL
eukprot:SAG31_NODE_7809_length_1592_cov_0.941728_2_plen_132_part_00